MKKTEVGGAEGIWEIGCGGKRGRGESQHALLSCNSLYDNLMLSEITDMDNYTGFVVEEVAKIL